MEDKKTKTIDIEDHIEEISMTDEEINIEDEEISIEDEEISIEDEEKAEITHEEIIEALLEENKKLKEEYLRAFADAENTKKRARQEIEKNSKYAVSNFAKSMISVADNLQRAMDNIPSEQETILEGLKLTQAELINVFKKFNIEKIDALGKSFDPNYHQVMQEIEDESKPTGTIIAEIQTGYIIQDRILRESMVVVTKGGK